MEADPSGGDGTNPLPSFVQQHADLHVSGAEPFGVVTGVGEGEAGIQNVIDEEHIPSAEISPALPKALQAAGGTGALVAGDGPELHFRGRFEVAEKIHDEKDTALEQGDNGQRTIPVKFPDGMPKDAYPVSDPGGGDVVLAGGPRHWPAAVGVRRLSSSEILAVRGPLILRSRPFCQEARALDSSSSWAKQSPA